MLFASYTTNHHDSGLKSDATMNTFQWLLVLGFPVEVAAAKAMPELFSDANRTASVTDGMRVFSLADAA